MPAGPDDPEGFGVEAALVGNIHRDILRIGAIEAFRLERQIERARLAEVDAVAEPDLPGQTPGNVAEGFRQVDARDPAAEAVGHVAGRAADTAPDIQQAIAGRYRQQVGHFHRRLDPAPVEMIERREVAQGQPGNILPRCRQRPDDRVIQPDAAVMIADCGVVGHAASNLASLTGPQRITPRGAGGIGAQSTPDATAAAAAREPPPGRATAAPAATAARRGPSSPRPRRPAAGSRRT